MKPTCLTPGCALPFDHTVAHSKTEAEPSVSFGDVYARQKVSDYVATGPTGVYSANMPAMPPGEPTRFYERLQYTNLPPRPVTLEGLAAVIGAASQALSVLYGGNFNEEGHKVAADLVALSAKAREVACGKEETGGIASTFGMEPKTAGEAVRAVHQRIASMSDDELERRAEAIATRDDASGALTHRPHLKGCPQEPNHEGGCLQVRVVVPTGGGRPAIAAFGPQAEAVVAAIAPSGVRQANVPDLKNETARADGYTAGYNRAITDAHNAMADEFGHASEDPNGVRAQAAIRKLYRSTP